MAWAPAYAAVADLSAWIQDASSAHTAQLTLAIEAASRAVDKATNRQFGLIASPEDRFYTAEWHRDICRWIVDIDDVMTQTGLIVSIGDPDSGTYVVEDNNNYRPLPVNAGAKAKPWTRIEFVSTVSGGVTSKRDAIQVSARWGWTTVPDTIKLATMIQASRLFARRASPFGVAGNPELGEMRLLERLDVDLMTSVQPFVRHWGAV